MSLSSCGTKAFCHFVVQEMLGTSSEPEAYEAPGFHVRRNESQENKQEDGSTWDRHDIASGMSNAIDINVQVQNMY